MTPVIKARGMAAEDSRVRNTIRTVLGGVDSPPVRTYPARPARRPVASQSRGESIVCALRFSGPGQLSPPHHPQIRGWRVRIGVIGPVGPDLFAENIGDALRRLGHEAIMFGAAHARVPGRVPSRVLDLARSAYVPLDLRLQSKLATTVIAGDCELVINIDSRLTPAAVEKIRRSGARTAFWFPDAVSNLGRQFMLLAPYDAVFFKEPHLVDRVCATLDLPVHYLPEGFNPVLHRPVGPGCVEPYLAVAGNMYPSRVRLLERLTAEGVPLRLYGAPFPRWLGPTTLTPLHTGEVILGERKAQVFRAAAGVLNSMHPAEIHGVNNRLFEAAASGGAVLTEFREALPDLFEVGREVLAYESFDELLAHAHRLLEDQLFGANLGDAAAARSLADHSHDNRVSRLLDVVF